MLLVFVAAATAAVAAWATSPTALLAVASPTSLLVAAIALAVFGVFLGDILVSFVDPRIKLTGGQG